MWNQILPSFMNKVDSIGNYFPNLLFTFGLDKDIKQNAMGETDFFYV